ncbi:sigma factor-like helix-turn-helix DNA-binding protein [Serratia marcescens]
MSERAWLFEVFRLHYQEQLSQNRIAKQLGLPRSTVNSCFQRAIALACSEASSQGLAGRAKKSPDR